MFGGLLITFMQGNNFKITRTLHFVRNGTARSIEVVIGGIEKVDDATYLCRFSLPCIGPEHGHVYGSDPMQALEICLRTIRKVVAGVVRNGSAEIWWNERGDHGGFEQE